MYWHLHAWNGNRNSANSQTKDNTEEYAADVRFFESLNGIAEETFHIVHSLMFANHSYAVAILQSQIVGGKELDVATQYSAHINSI